MSDESGRMDGHPKGTLLLIGLYGVLFAVGWFAIYFLVYLRRGGMTP